MYRSFTDRVFAGVCGGLSEILPVNAWVIRLIFVVLTPFTLGAAALLYLILWLTIPQVSLVAPGQRGGLWLVLALLMTVAVLGGWYAHINGLTRTATGTDLFYPLVLLALSVVFLIRQFGGTSS